MRRIDKGQPIKAFVDFVKKNKPKVWKETKNVSWEWRDYILEKEQHGLSGYTEIKITTDGSHIDHFRMRSIFQSPQYVFDWNNFVVDSKDSTYGSKYKDEHVKNKLDNEKLINPVEEDASRFFEYEVNGKIVPAKGLTEEETVRAQFTIDMFNLNEPSLKSRRSVILRNDIKSFEGMQDSEIIECLHSFGFPSVVEQLLKERNQEEDFI